MSEPQDKDLVADPPPPQPVDPRLLEILVCPLTKQPLIYDRARNELISRAAGIASRRARRQDPPPTRVAAHHPPSDPRAGCEPR